MKNYFPRWKAMHGLIFLLVCRHIHKIKAHMTYWEVCASMNEDAENEEIFLLSMKLLGINWIFYEREKEEFLQNFRSFKAFFFLLIFNEHFSLLKMNDCLVFRWIFVKLIRDFFLRIWILKWIKSFWIFKMNKKTFFNYRSNQFIFF